MEFGEFATFKNSLNKKNRGVDFDLLKNGHKNNFVNESNFSGQDSLDSPDSLKGFFSQVCQIELPKSMEAPILSEPPPPMKKVSPQPVPKPRRLQRPFGPNVICTFKNQVHFYSI